MNPRRPLLFAVAVLIVVLATPACSDDDGDGDGPSATTSASASSTSTSDATTTSAPAVDDALRAVMLEAGDLPEGYTESSEVDDTITSFCAVADAAAGLQASAREVRGFGRESGGASVVQLAFRFKDDGAATFVAQADQALTACSGVPDGSGTGLAFEYEPLAPEVEAVVATAGEARTGRHGTSVGSGSFTLDVVVLHRGDIGVLVAVLGVSLPRAELDALAVTAFSAAAERL